MRAGVGYRFRSDRSSSYASMRLLLEGHRHVAGPTVYLNVEQPHL